MSVGGGWVRVKIIVYFSFSLIFSCSSFLKEKSFVLDIFMSVGGGWVRVKEGGPDDRLSAAPTSTECLDYFYLKLDWIILILDYFDLGLF